MNSSQIHLALTHLPVVLSLVGLAVLVIAMFRKNPTITRVAFYTLIAAGISALPVYFSGEGAEHMVESLPGVSENLIENHEDVAKAAMFAVMIAAIAAIVGLFTFTLVTAAKFIRVLTLLFAIIATGLMAQTAHLGGQIRHSEIRQGFIASSETTGDNENGGDAVKEEEEDDD